jgi:hypothetical protein
MKDTTLERSIMSGIRQQLAILGVTLWRRNTGALRSRYKGRDRFVRFGEPGAADLWGVGPEGRHWEIEVKRPGQRPTMKQAAFLMIMHQQGAVAFWVDSIELAERVAVAILDGGRVKWHEDGDYDIEFDPEDDGLS